MIIISKHKLSIFLIFFLISVFQLISNEADTLDKYIYEFSYHGKKYEFLNLRFDYTDALRAAIVRGGYLVAIDSKEENDALLNFVVNGMKDDYGIEVIDKHSYNTNVWTGGEIDLNQDNYHTWYWVMYNSKQNNGGLSFKHFFKGTKDYFKDTYDSYNNWGRDGQTYNFPIHPFNQPPQQLMNICVSFSIDGYYNEDLTKVITHPGQWMNQIGTILNYSIIEYDCLDTLFEESTFNICFGETIEFAGKTITESGIYRDTSLTYSYCDSVHTLTVIANNLETKVSKLESSIFCEEAKADKYEWYNCANLDSTVSLNARFYSPKTTGSYCVTVTKGLCEFTSDCYEFCFPTSHTIDTVKCENDVIEINGIEYTKRGFYTQTLKQEGFDCDSLLEIDVKDISINKTIQQVSGKLVSSESGGEYQWYNCDGDVLISDATGKEFAPSEDGEYKVEITKQGCIDYSECYAFSKDVNSVKDIAESTNISVENKQIVFYGLEYSEIELIDLNSRTIYKTDQIVQSINIDYLNSGVYFLKIVNGNKTEMFKFLVVE